MRLNQLPIRYRGCLSHLLAKHNHNKAQASDGHAEEGNKEKRSLETESADHRGHGVGKGESYQEVSKTSTN